MVDAGADVYHVHKLIVCSQDMSMLFMGGLVVVMRMKEYHVHKPAVCSQDISMQFMGGLVVANGADKYHVHKLMVCSQDTSMQFMGSLVVVNDATCVFTGHLHAVYRKSCGDYGCGRVSRA